MYLTYLDDSGSEEKARCIVIGATVIRPELIQEIEVVAGAVVEELIPPERLAIFEEFHACELFAGHGVFEEIGKADRTRAMITLLHQLARFDIPFIYSAVDKHKLITTAVGSANPLDVAFRMCMLGVEEWLKQNDERSFALMVCDDTTDKALKHQLRSSFRALRPRQLPPTWLSGRITHVHDEMYFGNSKDSIGLQVADVCTWVIHRSLGEDDVPDLYEEIARNVICSKVEPHWGRNREIFLEYNPNVHNIL